MISKFKKLALAAAATGSLLCAHAALAGLLTVQVGANVCVDGAACDLSPGVNNVVIFNPVTPGFNVSITIGTSNNPGSTPFSLLDATWNINTIGSPPGAGGPLTVLVSQTGFTFPSTALATLESVCSGDMLGGNVTCQQWVGLNNQLNALGPITPGPQGPFTAPFSSDLSIAYNNPGAPSAFSITERLLFNLSPNGTTTGDFRSTVRQTVPEPATLALFGAALAGLGFLRRRKQS